jgi:hypothetical protein
MGISGIEGSRRFKSDAWLPERAGFERPSPAAMFDVIDVSTKHLQGSSEISAGQR